MPAFAAVGSQLGFDDEVTPAWVTVPASSTKTVLLKDALGLSVTLRNPPDKASSPLAKGRLRRRAAPSP